MSLNKVEIESIRDLVNVTFSDMYCVCIDFKNETININYAFLTEPGEIKLSIAELILCKNSAKRFINYLKEKITEGLKGEYHE